MAYKVGILGATGAVGQEIIRLLHDRNFPFSELHLLASANSAGKIHNYAGNSWIIQEATEECFSDIDICIFSAGAAQSLQFAEAASKSSCIVIDNSSAFRMNPSVPLIIPEVNPDAINDHKGIIANPNCSTAIALMGLYPLHQAFGLKRFIASTYQAVSGSGAAGLKELETQIKAWSDGRSLKSEVYPHQIAFNLIPHVDSFEEDRYTREEMKMLHESKKIMGIDDLLVSCTCVRVPVFRAHCISISAEFERPVSLQSAHSSIQSFQGVELVDDPDNLKYPMPLNYSEKVPCAIGRIRKDRVFNNGLAIWVTGDQLWKGAALNAIQIAELLHTKELIN